MKYITLLKQFFSFKAGFLFIAILAASFSFAQRRSGYLGLDAGIYATDHYDPGIGAHFSGNAEVANALYLGAEVGAIKFKDLDRAYVPLLLRFSAMPPINSARANLLLVMAPGYGFYDHSFRRNNNFNKSKGGFTFYGGVGAAFKGKGRGYLSITVGYSSFGFSTNGYKSNIDGVGIRIGAMFK